MRQGNLTDFLYRHIAHSCRLPAGFPKLFVSLIPGSINKGNVAMFALATATMWNEEK